MVPTTEQVTYVGATKGTTRSLARAAAEPTTRPATSGMGAEQTTPRATSEAATERMTGLTTPRDEGWRIRPRRSKWGRLGLQFSRRFVRRRVHDVLPTGPPECDRSRRSVGRCWSGGT